jgi:hypothetical protein
MAPTPDRFTVERREAYAPASQVRYLIAFKNDVIRAADQYWVNGTTLYYLTPDHEQKTAPVATVDRTLSQKLNSEQNVAFYLPFEQRKTQVRLSVVRHSANRVKQCRCTSVAVHQTRSAVGVRSRGDAGRIDARRP